MAIDKEKIETYQDARSTMNIWSEDITNNEAYLAEKAFKGDSLADAAMWGNHLLRILKFKAGMQHQYKPQGSSEMVDL